MYTVFRKTIEKTFAIEQYALEEQALARMEYLGLNNWDSKTTGFFVESGDLRLVAEWEV